MPPVCTAEPAKKGVPPWVISGVAQPPKTSRTTGHQCGFFRAYLLSINARLLLSTVHMARLDGRNQVVAEGPIQIVARGKAPVAAGGPIVHVRRPGIHQPLPLFIHPRRNLSAGKSLDHDLAYLAG